MVDRLACDDGKGWLTELRQERSPCHDLLDIVRPDADGELGHQINVLIVLALAAGHDEIGSEDLVALIDREPVVVDGIVKKLGERPVLDDVQAARDRTEIGWRSASVVEFEHLAVEAAQPVLDSPESCV